MKATAVSVLMNTEKIFLLDKYWQVVLHLVLSNVMLEITLVFGHQNVQSSITLKT